ncbi:MAG TPA: coniferyl aldehyde dehydrogenase [Accumulibacter sp.]|nr:coniferyl aldehyde dehydrogenase [Accumulibacter sp.]
MASRFARLQAAARHDPNPAPAIREKRLHTLERLLRDEEAALIDAVGRDFGHRSPAESRLFELFPSHQALRHARRHLRRWMRPQRRPVGLWFQPARAEVRYSPLGAVGVMVPWNYPLYLAIAPLASALAAGNRALVKMSEFTPATATLFAELLARHFADDELSVVEGDAAVAQEFARLPFDHLLFTGSTAVGRSVMRSAAENLTPVTLELGGKSPAIIGPGLSDRHFVHAVERIVVGKCLNAGQTCIAPDYVLLPAGTEEAFVEQARRVFAVCYPDVVHSTDYSSVIDPRQYARLTALLDEARSAGTRVFELTPGVAADPLRRRFPPVILLDPADDLRVMREEIFGPLLPVRTYSSLDEALAYVNRRPRPLALYYFDQRSANIERVLDGSVSGGVTVNDVILHIAQDELPFGGVGPSGMGRYHGFAGFKTFSVERAVFRQSRLSGIGLFKPPYGALFDRLTRLMLR